MQRGQPSIAAESKADRGEGTPFRVVVVDDQRLVREGMCALLAGQTEISVAGEAATAAAALAECHRVRPDVLLVDALLPEMAAFTLIRQVRSRYPETGVIALVECDRLQCMLRPPGSPARGRCWLLAGRGSATRAASGHARGAGHRGEAGGGQNGGNGRQECVEQAFLAGAHGVLRKTQSSQELLHAIRAAAGGERWTDAKTSSRTMSPGTVSQPTPDPGMHEELTRREVEVIREILSGHSNKEIARMLGLREQTVKNVVSRVVHKLHVHDRVQIALYALETRLLERYAALLASGSTL